MRKFGAALAAAALLATAGCGGDGRPSADDISTALQKGGNAAELGLDGELPDKAADCIAKALVESEISDEALESIVDGEKDYKLSKADEKALGPAVDDLSKCVSDLG